MQNRGRPSQASLVALPTPPTLPGARPEPPPELEPAAAAEWNAIVARMPSGWFMRETHGILAELCRSIAQGHRIAAQIEEIADAALGDEEIFKRYETLTRLRLQLASNIGNLSTKLRLTNQSRDGTRAAARKAAATKNSTKPWEVNVAPSNGSDDNWEA